MGDVLHMPIRRDAAGNRLEPMVTGRQLAAHFSVSEGTIRRWRRLGMPSTKFRNGARRYKISECEAWLRGSDSTG